MCTFVCARFSAGIWISFFSNLQYVITECSFCPHVGPSLCILRHAVVHVGQACTRSPTEELLSRMGNVRQTHGSLPVCIFACFVRNKSSARSDACSCSVADIQEGIHSHLYRQKIKLLYFKMLYYGIFMSDNTCNN